MSLSAFSAAGLATGGVGVWQNLPTVTPDYCLYGGFILSAVVLLAYFVRCLIVKEQATLNAAVDILVCTVGLAMAARTATLICEIHESQISLEDKFFFFLGSLALAWVSIESIVRKFRKRRNVPPAGPVAD
jgi:hypothetical protein